MRYFDCHADTLTGMKRQDDTLRNNHGDVDLERVGAFAEVYAQIFAIWGNRAEMDREHLESEFAGMYDRAKALLEAERERLVWCRSGEDMKLAHAAGKAAAFLSVEDVSIMGKSVEQIRELGIRFAMLTWNYENEYACGSVAGQERGLTEEGKQLAKWLLEQEIVLDVSHLSDQGVEDLLNLTDKPLIASHSNVREICRHPRNLSREQIRELIHRNGLIGMNVYRSFVGTDPDCGVQDILRHMDVVLELGGEDVLALGADFDGCGGAFPKGIRGVQSMPYLRECMEKAGFGTALTEKIFFENAARFVKEQVK